MRDLFKNPKDFWSRFGGPVTDECWVWPGYIRFDGYGEVRTGAARWLTHRLAWTLANGPIPDGMFVCHKCDSPPCCNPDHLFIGTNADNIADMIAKGRTCTGSKHGNSKLTEDQVLEIRSVYRRGIPNNASPTSQGGLAKRFNVSRELIRNIVKRRVWTHV